MRTNAIQLVWSALLRGRVDARRSSLPRAICLRRDEVVRLETDCEVKRIRVREGQIWLTGAPADGDVVLGPGDEFELTGAWPFVLQALSNRDAVVEIISS